MTTAMAANITTKDGTIPCHAFFPEGKGSWPAVIFYMDAIAIRPELFEMANRLASMGYYVLLPDLFYRSGSYKPFVAAEVFQGGPERERMMTMLTSINNKLVMQDTKALLEFLGQQSLVAGPKMACVGYCMGGAFALSAAGIFPDRVAAAASFHGARLATELPDSPHLLASKMRAKIYVGIAELDTHFTPVEKQRLQTALEAAQVPHTLEVYPGVHHGFAVNGTPAFNREASECHWQRLGELFGEALRGFRRG